MIDKLKHTYNVLEPGLALINNEISIDQEINYFIKWEFNQF